jgi:hypothetical protein
MAKTTKTKTAKAKTTQEDKFLSEVSKMETKIGEALDAVDVPVSGPACCAMLLTAAHVGHMCDMTLEQMVVWLEQGIENSQEHIADMEANGIFRVRDGQAHT